MGNERRRGNNQYADKGIIMLWLQEKKGCRNKEDIDEHLIKESGSDTVTSLLVEEMDDTYQSTKQHINQKYYPVGCQYG